MLKVLLQLWWTQKKRTFDWKKLGISVYFLLCLIVGYLCAMDANKFNDRASQIATVPMAMMVMPTCLIFMFIMKIEENGVDNAIKSRPISKLTWGKFIVISNIVDYWTAFPPVLIGVVACLMMPFGYALLTFVLAYLFSITVALFVTSVRLSHGYLLLAANWVGFACFLTAIILVIAFGVSLLTVGALTFATGAITLLYACCLFVFIYNLDNYNEQKTSNKRVVKIHRSKNFKIRRFTMEWASLWRTDRFKKPIILLLLIFTLDAYFLVNPSGPEANWTDKIGNYGFFICIIIYAPLILGQFMLGIEANFIDGLLTKPYALEEHLRTKYYFFIALNCLSALLLVPGVFFNLWGIDLIISSVIFSFSINLMLFVTCLKSSRIDIFSNGFFNYQGANMAWNIYGLMPMAALGLYLALLIQLPSIYVAEAILCGIGICALAIHKWVIKIIAKRFMAKKYERLDKLRK